MAMSVINTRMTLRIEEIMSSCAISNSDKCDEHDPYF